VNRLNWDHIFSPTLLSHFAYGYLNRNEGYGSVSAQDPTKLPHIPNAAAYNASPAAGFSGNGISNYPGWGNTQGFGPLNKSTRPSHIMNELIPWCMGRTIKFGGEFRICRKAVRINNNQSGTVNFSALSTALPGWRAATRLPALVGAVDRLLNVYNVNKYGPARAYTPHVGDTRKSPAGSPELRTR
jgi:hypothetical protein